MSAAPMTGEEAVREIRTVRFRPVRLPEGYDMGDVDTFLLELEEEARRGGDLGELVRRARFGKVRIREGYAIAEVDEFLERMGGVEVTSAAPPEVTPPPGSSAWAIRTLVDRVRFTPVRLREGYDMASVDRLLDQVVEAADRGEPLGAVVHRARLPHVRMREGYDIGEVDRFLEQLEGATVAAVDPGVIEEQKGIFRRILDGL